MIRVPRIIGRVSFGLALISVPAIVVAATTLPPPVTTTGSSTTYLFRALNTGTGPGVIGNSSGGYGVYAITGSASTAALRATNTASTAGIAVAATSAGNTINADSTLGSGVVGSTALNGSNAGNFAAGVRGIDRSTSGAYNAGVRGSSTNGTGVSGTSAHGYGVEGVSTQGDAAVHGYLTASGTASVFGDDESCLTTPAGHCGETRTVGVFGKSRAGFGVAGGDVTEIGCITCDPNFDHVTAGVEGTGPFGIIAVNNGQGTFFPGGGSALYATTSSSDLSTPLIQAGATILNVPVASLDAGGNLALNGTLLAGTEMSIGPVNNGLAAAFYGHGPSGSPLIEGNGSGCAGEVFEFDNNGNLILCGSLTQFGQPMAIAHSINGGQLVTYEPREADPTIEDVGSGQIVSGVGVVMLNKRFASTIDPSFVYKVFLTANGDNRGLYVSQKSVTSFTVRESQAGHSTLAFDYRIVAKPWDTNAARQPSARMLKQIADFYLPKRSAILQKLMGIRKKPNHRP